MISERISADLKQAMLNRDSQTVSVLRMVQSELKNAGISKMGELDEQEEISVLRKEIKKREDASAAFTQGNSPERAALEDAEAVILKNYLPAGVDDETIRAFLKQQAETLGALEPRHKGDLIRALMAEYPGRIEGKKASELVQELFQS